MQHTDNPYRKTNTGRYALLVIVCLILSAALYGMNCISSKASSTSETPVEQETHRLFGFIDRNGKVAIAPQYKAACDFHEGLAAVSNDLIQWGYIDKSGKTVLPFKYEIAGSFSEGLAPVMGKDNRFYYIDKYGKEVLSTKYINPGEFSEGFAPVQDASGKYGYINKSGRLVIKPRFFQVLGFKEGLALVDTGNNTNSVFGYIDKTGKEVIKPKYDRAESFSEGWAMVSLRGKGVRYIDKSGKIVLSLPENCRGYSFSEGLAFLQDLDSIGYIDKSGKYVFRVRGDMTKPGSMKPIGNNPPDVFFRGTFHEEFANALVGMEHVGFINKTGQLVIGPIAGKEVYDFSDGMAMFAADVPVPERSGDIMNSKKEQGIPNTARKPNQTVESIDPVERDEQGFDEDRRDVIIEPKENRDDYVEQVEEPK